ncbi:restriction endonuclease subunit S [Ruminococcus sp. AM18-44]|nr:restriction endonuclease subunit S [Ruminococcus sp. AM18-44]
MGKPDIRFKGYTDEWEQRKLSDIYDSIGNAFVGTATPYYAEQGHFYLESNNVKDGQINHNSEIFINDEFYEKQKDKWLHTGDMVMVQSGHVGHAAVIPEELDNTAAHALIMFRNPKEEIEPYFLNYEYQTDKAKKKIENITTGNTIKHILASDMQEFVVDVPNYEEQKVIASYFRNIDHLITLHQRKCDEVKSLKKYMLQKMFPQNEQKVPEIRFEGFTEAWEQRKLGELYQRNTERNENLIGYDKTISVATMSYKDDGNGASESSLSTYKVIRVGDIAFEGHTNKQFRFGRFVVNDIGTGIMSPRFSTLRPLNEMPVNFWKQYIHSESVMRRILVNSTKAGTMMNELVIPEFLNQTIMVPSENEQAIIGQYFTNLDHLITLHQQKCEELKKIKKFMLQKMFV